MTKQVIPSLCEVQITGNGLGLMHAVAFPVLKAALNAGANVWSGAVHYGTPESNTLHLLSCYFTAYPADADKVILGIKGGAINISTMDCSPESMRNAVNYCNRILNGTKKLDFFGPARVDPNVPIETTVKALGELVTEGLIAGILLSEVSATTIKRAEKIHHVSMVEAEVSLWATDILHNGVAETCKELGIVVLAHTPLGRGMLAGNFQGLEDIPEAEAFFYSSFPKFQGENFEQNLKLVRELQKLAVKKGCTNAQFALAWLKSIPGAPTIIPIAGARSKERVEENYQDVLLTEDELGEVDAVLGRFPVSGERYPAAAAGLLEY